MFAGSKGPQSPSQQRRFDIVVSLMIYIHLGSFPDDGCFGYLYPAASVDNSPA